MYKCMSRPLLPGLFGGLLLSIGACVGSPLPTSIFVEDAGSDGSGTPRDDGARTGDDATLPIQLGDDAAQQDTPANDACTSASCGDAQAGFCGDGVIQSGEQCDDGNSMPGDGCSGLCQIEPGYTCPTPGLSCIYTVPVKCGDGIIEGNEQCDDGNLADGDGCSSMCQVERGWSCSVPGMPCMKAQMPRCGDGAVNSGEQCDDGNTMSGDGCSATCQLEPGWTCPAPGSACKPLQYCGDGILQTASGEQCDDGNAVPGDGCSGVCTAVVAVRA